MAGRLVMTHEVHFDTWYLDRNGDWDLRPGSSQYWSEEAANAAAERMKAQAILKRTNVRVVKLETPIEVDAD